ncbi:MAG: histidine phosphatase family protein [Pseudomonadota bacterium]
MRHGQTQYNLDKRLTGHTDIPLTEEGKDQGRRAGQVLKHFEIDIAYTSPLIRARMTLVLALDAANRHSNLKDKSGNWDFRERYELIEKDVGDFAGHNHQTCPKLRQQKRGYDVRLPNGESNKDVVERVRKFYEDELKPLMDQGKTVVVSCHSVVKRAFHVVLGEVEPERMYELTMENAQPWVISYTNGVKNGSTYINPQAFHPKALPVDRKNKPKPPKFG